MDNIQLSQANQVYISNQTQNNNATSSIQESVQQIEDGENKINKVLIGLGVLGAAAIGITCVIRGRKPKNASTSNTVQKLVKKFNEIDFNKGTARLKDGSVFTGAVEKVSENGDKLSLEYVDGILQKSTKTTNGVEVIKEYVDGVISKKNGKVVDIKKVQDEVKAQQAKLKELLANGEISSEEFKKQTDEIKFKSKKQEAEIKETLNKKVEAEKAEADRITQEAQEKAEAEAKAKTEADRLKKEAEEKAEADRIAQEKAFTDFKKSLKNMSDEELENSYNVTIARRNELRRKAQKLEQESGVPSTSEYNTLKMLNKSERQEYELLERKIDIISIEQTNRDYDFVNKILCMPEDTMVATKHCTEYINSAEYKELTDYYDNYECNDYYRGNKKAAMNVNEGIMDGLFRKAPALEEEAVVYRAVNSAQKTNQGFIDSFKDGVVLENPGYTSTATKVDKQFYRFAGDVAKKTEDGVLMRIHLPKGTKGVLGGHNEYLLPRNSQIKVNKIEIINGVKVADCEYILP